MSNPVRFHAIKAKTYQQKYRGKKGRTSPPIELYSLKSNQYKFMSGGNKESFIKFCELVLELHLHKFFVTLTETFSKSWQIVLKTYQNV